MPAQQGSKQTKCFLLSETQSAPESDIRPSHKRVASDDTAFTLAHHHYPRRSSTRYFQRPHPSYPCCAHPSFRPHRCALTDMLAPSPFVAAFLLSFSLHAAAAPQDAAPGLSIPLKKRSPSARTPDEWGVWAENHRLGLESKYGNPQPVRRATGSNLCVVPLLRAR